MILTLTIIAVILALSALADGATTVRAIRHGDVEVDPLMIWIFGTNTPSASDVYGRGMGMIALEILAAFFLYHFWQAAGYVLLIGGLFQSAVHMRAAVQNWNLVK